MVGGFFKGISYLFTGLSLITQKRIRPFVVVPLLINILVFSGGIWLASSQVSSLMERLLPSWLSWLEWLLWPLFFGLIFFAVFYTFSLIANLIAAPFNSILAERVENHLRGQPVPEFQGYKTLPAIITRTFRSELAKLMYMFKWLILLLIITVIPVVNLIAPFAWALYGAWMLAIEYADYPMGNHEKYFKDELPALKKHRSHALGFGGGLSVMTLIPVVNFLAMPVGVAGGTAFWVDRLSK
uniref:Sulfate transporter, CysZ-type n=1 Tax=uncultured Thiotrichaceae bacterium TaxID=298394 RepID=A0A6S6UBZ9_9GAMM|nr:MAG: Sulfate transporter, CysZ-type [uncultured Thiotrichaceae bacterium]